MIWQEKCCHFFWPSALRIHVWEEGVGVEGHGALQPTGIHNITSKFMCMLLLFVGKIALNIFI
jgi:hypothetical protein